MPKVCEMETVVPMNKIVENPKNIVRKHRNSSDVEKSILKHGYITPIIVDENYMILSGHQRFNVLKKLDYQTVPQVLKVSGMTEEEKQDFLIRDNKAAENVSWDMAELKKEYSELIIIDMGFKLKEKKISDNLNFLVIECESADDMKFLSDRLQLHDVDVIGGLKKITRGKFVKSSQITNMMKGN